MRNEHQILAKGVRSVYVNAGPTDPRAGPTFPIEAAEPPIAEIKSKPWILKTPAPIIKSIR